MSALALFIFKLQSLSVGYLVGYLNDGVILSAAAFQAERWDLPLHWPWRVSQGPEPSCAHPPNAGSAGSIQSSSTHKLDFSFKRGCLPDFWPYLVFPLLVLARSRPVTPKKKSALV